MSKPKTVLRFLSDSVTIMLGVYCVVLGLTTAYSIDVDSTAMLIFCAGISLLFGGVFGAFFNKIAAAVAVVVTLAAGAWFFSMISLGARIFISTLTTIFSRFVPALGVFPAPVLDDSAAVQCNTFFFCALAAILALGIGFLLIKCGHTTASLALTLPLYLLCLLHLASVPDMLSLTLFAAFVISGAMLAYARDGKEGNASIGGLLVIPCTLILLVGLNMLFPAETYRRLDFADSIYVRLAEILPLKPYKPGDSPDEESGSSGVIPNIPELSYADIRSDAWAHYTNNFVMSVSGTKAGHYLLRGISYGAYTGGGWRSLDSASRDELDKVAKFIYQGDGYETKMIYAPVSFAATYAIAFDNPSDKLYVYNDYHEGEIYYIPYYSALPDSPSSYYVYNDTAVLTSDTLTQSIFTVNGLPLDAYSGGSYPSSDRVDWTYISDTEKEYSALVRKYYTANSDATGYVTKYVLGSFTPSGSQVDDIAKIASLVRGCGTYNLNTAPTPAQFDVVEYFLTVSHEGVCSHFASVGVLAFRAAGYPARYVTGYSADVKRVIPYGANPRSYRNAVTEKQAHAWVEVYLDTIGWIAVDVTPGYYYGAGDGETSVGESTTVSETSDDVSDESVPEESKPVSVSSGESIDNTSVGEPKPAGEFPYWVAAPAALLLALLIVVLRRRSALASREESFRQKDKNKAAIAAWVYIEKLAPYGVKPSRRLYSVALEAKFSLHTLDSGSAAELANFAKAEAKKVDASLGFMKKLVFRYVRNLY